MLYAICLGLFLPLVGFLSLMTFSNVIGRRLAGIIGCATILISFVSFASLLYVYVHDHMHHMEFTLFQWIPIKGIGANFTLAFDSLTLVMTLIITGVGFLIHVYSNGYMDHDKDIARYFGLLNFFVFAMLLLVLAGHLLLLFVGWEGVGLASYLLIGYWYEKPAAAQAAIKAFVINRIGDLGLLLGLLLTFYTFGTGNMEEINQRVGNEFADGSTVITVMTLLYFIGAVGKSAQIPLQTWLPDAMEGPTPVSALIHAATMVTAGVYLVVRMHEVFMVAPLTMQIIGVIGGATALYAALCALAQTDLKRVLAYSTISQLGYMFLACGAGAFYAAMFHLTTHAFVKALLFLSAGNVVHMLHGVTEMKTMGGLATKLPITHVVFLIGTLALSGVPPLAAFFSKDLILEQEYLTGFTTLFYVGLVTAVLTAFYLTRAYYLTFLGKFRGDESDYRKIHEAPMVMIVPVILLAILSIFGGFLGFSLSQVPLLEKFLGEVGVTLAEEEPPGALLHSRETLMSIVGGLLGVFSALIIYAKFSDRIGNTIQVLRKSFYVNEIYDLLIVQPLKALSRFIAYFVEPRVFDGSIEGITQITQGTARGLQLVQSGQIRSYVAWIVLGMSAFIAYFILRTHV